MNIGQVITQLKTLVRETEEALRLVEGMGIVEDLELWDPKTTRDMTWAIVWANLSLYKSQLSACEALARQEEKEVFLSYLSRVGEHASVYEQKSN